MGRARLAAQLIINNITKCNMKKIILVFSAVILLTFTLSLLNGLKIQCFSTPYFSFEGLYLKLDKKLIFRLKNLEIYSDSKPSGSTSQLNTLLDNIGWMTTLFKEISLENIEYENTSISLVYFDEIFTLLTPYLALSANFDGKRASVEHLELKDFDLNYKGDLSFDIDKKMLDANGSISSFGINAILRARLRGDILELRADEVRAKNIDGFMNNLAKKIEINKEIKAWTHEYIKADDYYIKELYAKINIDKKSLDELSGIGQAKDANINFASNTEPAIAKKVDVLLKDDALSFHTSSATFRGKEVADAKVKIINLIAPDTHIFIDLNSSKLSLDDAKPILKAFELEVGDISSPSALQSSLGLDVKLEPLGVRAKGLFLAPNKSKFSMGGASFDSSGVEIALIDSKMDFKKANLKSSFIDVDFSGEIDFSAQSGLFDANIKKLDLSNVLSLNNYKTKAKISLQNGFELGLEDFDFKGNFGKEKSLEVADFKKILPFSSLLKNDINASAGSFALSGADFSSLSGQINLDFELGFLDKDYKPYNSDEFAFSGSFEKYNVKSKSTHIDIQSSKESGLNVFLNDLIIPISSKDKDLNSDFAINFIGKNSAILVSDFNRTFGFNRFGVKMSKDFEFWANYKEGKNINLSKDDKSLSLHAKKISERFVNDILGIGAFRGGEFDLNLKGADFSNFIVELNATNTHLAQFKSQQNLLSFLDTVPSLMSFKVPDFDKEGFNAKTAKARLERRGNILQIQKLEINGQSADIYGYGNIDLAGNEIKMQIEISLLKSATSVLSKIPIVNHIILGDDDRISTVLDVSGPLSDPKYSTSVTKDILSTPFNLIKNTITLPFNLHF